MANRRNLRTRIKSANAHYWADDVVQRSGQPHLTRSKAKSKTSKLAGKNHAKAEATSSLPANGARSVRTRRVPYSREAQVSPPAAFRNVVELLLGDSVLWPWQAQVML